MSSILLAVLIILGLIGLLILWKILKPYTLKYDTTLALTGGLGSGKTLTAVKTAVILLRKQRFIKHDIYNLFWVKIPNFFYKPIYIAKIKQNLKLSQQGKPIKSIKPLRKERPLPQLYSNIPIHFKKHWWSSKREWNKQLEAPHLLCLKKLEEYSVVLIDELPQFINQFNWNEELIKKNVNEFITYFRHLYAGYLITTSQSIDDVVVQIRRKLNHATWCYDFKKWFFGLFYTMRMCDIVLSDQISTMSTTYLEENTKLHFGMFPPKKTYDTRCYSERINNILVNKDENKRYKKLKTNKVLRLVKYISPLDDKTTKEQKTEQWQKGEKIWEN